MRYRLAMELDVPMFMPVPAIHVFHLFFTTIRCRGDQVIRDLFAGNFAASPPRDYTDVLLINVLVTKLLRTVLVSGDFEHNGLSIQRIVGRWSGVYCSG